MKLDKETLIKQQFWVAFGVLVPLALITLLWLFFQTAGANDAERQKTVAHLNELKTFESSRPKNEADMKKLQERQQKLDQKKDEFWKQGWESQKDITFWPTEVKEQLGKLKFGDPIDVKTCAIYAQPKVYPPQADELGSIFRTEAKIGKDKKTFETIQFHDGWRQVLTYVPDWTAKNQAPSSEEVWLAQEDLWVQREILLALREANNTIATFRPVEGPKPAAGELFRQSFANSEWQLDLAIVQKDTSFIIRGKIKNVSNRPLAIGKLFFLVQLHANEQPIGLPVEGDTISVGKEAPVGPYMLEVNRPDGILGVSQIYEGRIAPIRRIEELKLGACSHRTQQALQTPRFGKKDDAAIAPAIPAGGDAESKANRTEFGLVRDRYCDVTEQVRRLPVGLVLLVDQQHIPEVLTALTNCKLRLQIAQVTWKHYRGNLAAVREDKAGAADPKAKAPEVDQQSNLVELVIYAVASLYERYPTKEGAGEAVPAPVDPKTKDDGKGKAKADEKTKAD